MFCGNCGNKMNEGEKFCGKCGATVGSNSAPATNTVVVNNPAPKKKSHVGLILGIVFGVIALFVIIVVLLFVFIFKSVDSSSEKLVCTSNEGDITISYDDDGLTGYHANKITYDLDEQKELAEKYGVESYLEQFNDWFERNTDGTCVIKNEKDEVVRSFSNKDDDDDDDDDDKKTKPATTKTKVVGDEKYGYVEVPTNWVTFHDVDGGHSLQYSYGTTYIVTLDYVDNPQLTAKQAAQNLMSRYESNEEVTGLTGATVEIGKNKKYTAYQVYMYYPADDVFLVTYWFDGEDGLLHYVAIEGPDGITDYLSIPESFSLTK